MSDTTTGNRHRIATALEHNIEESRTLAGEADFRLALFVRMHADIILSAMYAKPIAWMYERHDPLPARYIHADRTPAYLTDGDGWIETPLYAEQGAGA